MIKKTTFSKIGESRILWIIVSLILSILLWAYVTVNEGEDYTQTFDNIPIVFNGEDAMREAQGLIVTEQTRSNVSVTIRGPRREVSKLRNSDIQAVIDLSTITRPGTNSNYYYTISYSANVDSSSFTIENRNPRTVSFTVDKFSFKYVDVVGIFNGNVTEGYKADVADMVFEPSTIRVSGPEEEISGVDKALVVIERNDVDSTIKVDMGYSLVDADGNRLQMGSMITDSDVVNVTLPVTVVKTVPLTLDIVHGAGTSDANVRMECDPVEIQISGDAEILKGINRISLGSLDLTEFNQTYDHTYAITLPNDVINESGISEAKVTIKLIGLTSKRLSVTNIVTTNVPDGYSAEVTTQSIDVTIRAPELVISDIKSSNLRAVLDLENYSDNEGQFTVPAVIKIDGFSEADVIYAQEYTALVQIKRGN